MVPHEKPKTISIASSIMKNIVFCPVLSRFSLKLICFIAFGWTSSACGLLKFIAIML